MAKPPSLLDKIEHQHNRLADAKMIWWPFVFLRPHSKADPIRLPRKMVMTACFAGWFVLAWVIRRLFVNDPLPESAVGWLEVYGWFCLGFFFWFSSVTIYFWNRRAAREGTEPGPPG